MVRKGIFWTIGEQSYIVYYPIISYQRIKLYRFETVDIGISHWNNGVIGTFLISIITTVLIVRYRYFGRIPTMIYVRMWNHMLNNVQFLVSDMSKEHRRLIT